MAAPNPAQPPNPRLCASLNQTHTTPWRCDISVSTRHDELRSDGHGGPRPRPDPLALQPVGPQRTHAHPRKRGPRLRRLTPNRRCQVRRRTTRHSLAAERTTEKLLFPTADPPAPTATGQGIPPAPGHLTGVCPPALRLGSLPTRDACPLSFPYPIIRLHQPPPAPNPGAPSQPLAPFSLISGLEKTSSPAPCSGSGAPVEGRKYLRISTLEIHRNATAGISSPSIVAVDVSATRGSAGASCPQGCPCNFPG